MSAMLLYYTLIVIRSFETKEKTVVNLPSSHCYHYRPICSYPKKRKEFKSPENDQN